VVVEVVQEVELEVVVEVEVEVVVVLVVLVEGQQSMAMVSTVVLTTCARDLSAGA
jgi:hypothetical protein